MITWIMLALIALVLAGQVIELVWFRLMLNEYRSTIKPPVVSALKQKAVDPVEVKRRREALLAASRG